MSLGTRSTSHALAEPLLAPAALRRNPATPIRAARVDSRLSPKQMQPAGGRPRHSLGLRRHGLAYSPLPCQHEMMEAASLMARIHAGEVQAVHSASELQEILASYASSLVVLFCKARRCRSCKYFNKKFQRVASNHPDTVFLELMCDESEDTFKLMQELEVPVVPHFVMYHAGCEQTRLSSTSEEKLINTINKCADEAMAAGAEEAEETEKLEDSLGGTEDSQSEAHPAETKSSRHVSAWFPYS